MFVLKIWHYLNYKDHFYKEFVCSVENKSVFGRSRTILEVSGGFTELERVNSHVAVYRYEYDDRSMVLPLSKHSISCYYFDLKTCAV